MWQEVTRKNGELGGRGGVRLHRTLWLWLEHLAGSESAKQDGRFQRKNSRERGVSLLSQAPGRPEGKCPAGS